jgi:hypothetical protein
MQYMSGRQEMHNVKRWLGKLRHTWKDNIKMELTKIECENGTGFIWLRVRSSGGLL